MKKFLIKVTTAWCGMDQDYAVIAESEESLLGLAENLAYTNFADFSCGEQVLEDNFEPDEDGNYSEEDIEAAYVMEDEYYGFEITEFDLPDEQWSWYKLIYDESEEV